jgi:HlyD family secretion protein
MGTLAAIVRRPRYRWSALVVVALLLGLGYWRWHSHRGAGQYVLAPVSLGDIQRTVTMTGALNPVITVQVGSYVSGVVKTLHCDWNTDVQIGQVCAKIDPLPYQVVVDQDRAEVATAEAQLKKDQAALGYAKINYERDQKLLPKGIVSQDTVDSDESVYRQALAQENLDRASIVSKKAALQAAVVNLAYTDIRSPVNGTVITRSVDVGQTVVSSLQSSTLFLIGKDLTKMQVDTNVSEADVRDIRVGQRATFTIQAYPNRSFEGRVREIRHAPITVQNVVTYDIVVAVDNPERLLFPGMTADTHIVLEEHHDVLRVPLPAIRFSPGGVQRAHRGEADGSPAARVWVLREGRVQPARVTTGLDDGTLVEVQGKELQAGDQVVVNEVQRSDSAAGIGRGGSNPTRQPGLRM